MEFYFKNSITLIFRQMEARRLPGLVYFHFTSKAEKTLQSKSINKKTNL